MTENEIKEATLEDAIYCAKVMACIEVCEECRFYGLCHTWCDDVYRIIINALEEVQAYRAIGTVEEFKALKSGDFSEHLLNMGYTKGYNKAIDEFAERLKENSIRGAFEYKPDKTKPWCKERKFCRVVGTRRIDEVAEQLKGGAE